MQFFTLAATLLSAVSAFQVTAPTANQTLVKGTDLNVRWTSVDTDPSTFSIYLVNFQTVHWPPTVVSLQQNVQRDAGSATVRIPCSVTSDYGWQINFINGTNTYVIYAQSRMFGLTGDCTDPAPSSGSAASQAQTVVIQNPVVWFVQPSNLVAAAAICPPSAATTVTVYANAPATTAAPVVCAPGQGVVAAAAAAAAPAGSASASAGAAGAAATAARTNGTGATTTTLGSLATGTALPRAASNNAGAIGASAALLAAGAFAALL